MNARRSDSARLRRLKPYPAYKDSGVEWLGEIPAHWEVRRLKFVSTLIMGQEVARVRFQPLGEAQGRFSGSSGHTGSSRPRVSASSCSNPRTSATTAAQSLSAAARFTNTQLLLACFSAVDLFPPVTGSHVRRPVHFFPLFSGLQAS